MDFKTFFLLLLRHLAIDRANNRSFPISSQLNRSPHIIPESRGIQNSKFPNWGSRWKVQKNVIDMNIEVEILNMLRIFAEHIFACWRSVKYIKISLTEQVRHILPFSKRQNTTQLKNKTALNVPAFSAWKVMDYFQALFSISNLELGTPSFSVKTVEDWSELLVTNSYSLLFEYS